MVSSTPVRAPTVLRQLHHSVYVKYVYRDRRRKIQNGVWKSIETRTGDRIRLPFIFCFAIFCHLLTNFLFLFFVHWNTLIPCLSFHLVGIENNETKSTTIYLQLSGDSSRLSRKSLLPIFLRIKLLDFFARFGSSFPCPWYLLPPRLLLPCNYIFFFVLLFARKETPVWRNRSAQLPFKLFGGENQHAFTVFLFT